MAMKKGSKQAKAWGLKMKRARAKKTGSRKPVAKRKARSVNSYKGGSKMVKRKTRKAAKKKTYNKSSDKVDIVIDVIAPIGYGYVRESVSDFIAPAVSKVPMGYVSDEIVLGVAAYVGNKKLRGKKAKKLCKNALIIEASRVGTTAKDFGLKKTFTGK